MSTVAAFLDRIESKVEQQIGSQNVGYLLGAGASYLNGAGYPLASELWNHISANVPQSERDEIQQKLDTGAGGLENALDLLDDGSSPEKPHRHLVVEAIAEHFLSITPSTEAHRRFVARIALRQELSVPLFCLNYDGLVESAADAERVRIVDGFLGVERPFLEPQIFEER